jgi:hypothetical protein
MEMSIVGFVFEIEEQKEKKKPEKCLFGVRVRKIRRLF